MTTFKTWALDQKYSEESLNELFARLTTLRTRENPVPQGLLPGPLDIDTLVSTLSDLEAYELLNCTVWSYFLAEYNSGNYAFAKRLVGILSAGKALTESGEIALLKQIEPYIPDPNWTKDVYASDAEIAGYSNPLITDLLN